MLKYVNSGTYLQTTVYQLPVVAKLNLSVGGDSISNFNGILSLYGGVGFNFGEPAYEYSGSFPVETVSSAPLSLITGGELGFGGVFRLFAGVRYIMDFEESTVRIDAHDFDQKRSLLILYLRATILIPFRKGR